VKAVHLSEKIQRAFVTLGLEELIEIHPTRESAFEAFAKPPGAGAS
jgi:hypothetical protein